MRLYPRLLAYGIAISSTAIALLLKLWLEPLLSETLGSFFYIAILISTWYGGFWPGFVTVILSTLAILSFFFPPLYQPWISQPKDLLQLIIFLLVALLINLLTSNFLKSKQKIQKLSQQLAQDNAEQLRMALLAAHMGMWDWNLITREIKLSPEHEQLFGLAVGSFDGRYETFDALVHPEDRSTFNQLLQQAIQTHRTYQCEFRVIWADGSIHWIELRGNAFYDTAGQPIRMMGTVMDIEHRKQAQEALRLSEERYRTLFESIDEGFCVIEMLFDENNTPLDYRFLEINPTFEKQTGLQQAVGKTARQLVPNLEDHWFETYGKVALTGEPIRFEHESAAMNRWFDVYALRVEQQSSRKVALVFQDITQRKQAEIALQQLNIELEQRVAERTAQLKEANDRLLEKVREQQQTQLVLLEQAQLLDLAHDTIIARDLDGAITFWNQGAEKMYHWKKAEVVGQISHILLKTQFSQPLSEIETELLENCYWEGEVTQFTRDDRPISVASRWALQTDNTGRPIKILEINNDITAKKQAEAALRQSEEKFRQLAENIQAVFWMKDHQSQQFIYVSKAYESLWQRSCENIYQKYTDWLEAIYSEDRQHVESVLTEQMRTGQSDVKYRIIRPDGSIRWIRDRAFPIKNEVGELVRIAGIAEDITELQQIELMKSEFIGIVSHELRTPLTSIRAAMGLLHTGIYDKKPDKFKRMIEIAAIDSDRLVRLVNDILDLERLESGRAVLEKTTCNVADLIEQAVGGLQAIAKEQNVNFNIQPTDAKVWAAADAIVQTLTNLLANALKFSPANSTITLSVQKQTDYILFQITDQGRGIPKDKLEAIFGRFQQVDASDSRSKGGTGLGLAICRSIIEQHNGQIWAESTVGVGSTFFFTLPMP